MERSELNAAVRDLLVTACGSSEALVDGVDLIESGLLDSLALITLLDGLEDLGIFISPTQVDRNAFRTLDGILALCQSFASLS